MTLLHMEEQEIILKPKKASGVNKVTKLFEDKKKRYLYMVLFMLPFIIAIGIFGFVAFKEAKSLLALATGAENVAQNKIESMNYVLRDNATDIQKEYFEELKVALSDSAVSDADAAGVVCKNFVADFYTWTNKQGQYDVGGMYYVYTPQKNTIYTQARDGFYKYLSNYIKDYGLKNLLEVENVEVVSAKNCNNEYEITTIEDRWSEELEDHYNEEVDYDYEAYEVTCNWTYKLNEKFDTSKYATKMNFIVVLNEGRFEIVEASENKIDVKVQEETKDGTESTDSEPTEVIEED